MWNHLILLDDDGQQNGTVGTVNNAHRKRWRAGYHVMVPGTVCLWGRVPGRAWWNGRGPTDKQCDGVMYIKGCCVARRRWIMSRAACKPWSENNKSCWLTVAVCGGPGTPCHLGSGWRWEASLAKLPLCEWSTILNGPACSYTDKPQTPNKVGCCVKLI